MGATQNQVASAMTDDDIDQTVRVDTSDSDQRPDDGTTSVQSNTKTIIHLADQPSIATDAEFKHMFQYLKDGRVTDNDDQDGRPILLSVDYTLRNKKQDRLPLMM